MKTSKHILLTLVFVLLSGLGAGVMAQNKGGSAFRLPPEPIVPVTTVNALEVTDGTPGYDSQTKQEVMFGYSFLGRTTGAYPGSFTLSMNCTPAVPVPSDKSELTGGSWTLPVYMTAIKGSGYAGALFGTVAKGTMIWDKTGTNATMYMVLSVDGGTQAWDGVGGYATFTGTLFVDEKTQKTMLTGDLVFNIISVSPMQ
jgi:hypothetical protein